MPPVGFEPTISAGERPQTYALDRAATRTGRATVSVDYIKVKVKVALEQVMKTQRRSTVIALFFL